MEQNKIKEQLEKAQIAINDLLATLREFQNVEVIEGVRPRFLPEQKVWIIKTDLVPSWFEMPVRAESFDKGFGEVSISYICIGKRGKLRFDGCGIKEEKKIGIAYNYSRNERNIEENKIWASLQEAMEFNQKQYGEEKKKYLKEQEDIKEEKRKRLKNELSELS